jgi:hypothetical protein
VAMNFVIDVDGVDGDWKHWEEFSEEGVGKGEAIRLRLFEVPKESLVD